MLKFLFFITFVFSAVLCPIAKASTSDTASTSGELSEAFELMGIDDISISISASDILGQQDVKDRTDFCVYSNETSSGTFKLTWADDTGNGYMDDGESNQVNYTVGYAVGAGQTNPAALLTRGTSSSTIALGSVPNDTCSVGLSDNMSLIINVPGSQLAGKPAGTYSDSLKITISQAS